MRCPNCSNEYVYTDEQGDYWCDTCFFNWREIK